jgi:uncharacterized protein YggE
MKILGLLTLIFFTFGQEIEVYGKAELYVSPDYAEFNFQIETIGHDLKKSYSKNKKTQKFLIQKLKDAEISKKNIKISHIEQRKKFRWHKNKQVFEGFLTSISGKIKINNLEKFEKINKVLASDTNIRINSISTGLQNKESIEKKLLIKAIENAKSKAKLMAKELGIKVGNVVFVSEIGKKEKEYPHKKRNISAITASEFNPGTHLSEKFFRKRIFVLFEIKRS